MYDFTNEFFSTLFLMFFFVTFQHHLDKDFIDKTSI